MSEPRSSAFLFGESVFTTLRVEDGKAFFADAHRERLLKSCEWLWPESTFAALHLLNEVKYPVSTGVWRLTLHQQGPREGARELLLDSWFSQGIPAPKTLHLRTCDTMTRAPNWPSFVKTSDYLARMVAARDLPPQTDPLFCVNGEMSECLYANIVFQQGNTLITPPAGPNVLAGIGVARIRNMARVNGFNWQQRVISVDEIGQFESAYAVNAVRGLIPVESIDEHYYPSHPIPWTVREFFQSDEIH